MVLSFSLNEQCQKVKFWIAFSSCLKEGALVCHHNNQASPTPQSNGCSHLSKKQNVSVGTRDKDVVKQPEPLPDVDLENGRERQRTAADDLYLQAIICIVIVLVVFAVGSAMMTSIQKIIQNRALNRLPYDYDNRNTRNLQEKIPYPKDIGANMYHYLSQRELIKQHTKADVEYTTYTNSYLENVSLVENAQINIER